MSTLQKCSLCAYFLPEEGGERGLCRRFPPAVEILEIKRVRGKVGDGDVSAIARTIQCQFPLMTVDGWCGEFAAVVAARVRH